MESAIRLRAWLIESEMLSKMGGWAWGPWELWNFRWIEIQLGHRGSRHCSGSMEGYSRGRSS